MISLLGGDTEIISPSHLSRGFSVRLNNCWDYKTMDLQSQSNHLKRGRGARLGSRVHSSRPPQGARSGSQPGTKEGEPSVRHCDIIETGNRSWVSKHRSEERGVRNNFLNRVCR